VQQQSLIPKSELKCIKKNTHGGVSLKKRRKTARPLIPGAITHVVLKSSKARGDLCFYKNKRIVHSLLKERAQKFFVEIIDYVNMGNHLHIKARFKDRKRFQNFLRTFSGLLARKLTKAHRGTKFGRFWDGLAYTRVLLSKIEELGLRIYFEGNHRQRELGYDQRTQYLKSWNQYLYRLRATRAAKTQDHF
jgi:REP element-mobilizing transposase RayT